MMRIGGQQPHSLNDFENDNNIASYQFLFHQTSCSTSGYTLVFLALIGKVCPDLLSPGTAQDALKMEGNQGKSG